MIYGSLYKKNDQKIGKVDNNEHIEPLKIQWCLWSVLRQSLSHLFSSRAQSVRGSTGLLTSPWRLSFIGAFTPVFLLFPSFPFFSVLPNLPSFHTQLLDFFLFWEILAHTDLFPFKIPTFLAAQDILLFISIFNLAFVISHSIMTFL